MNYLRFLNKSILAKCFLLLIVLMLGFFQLRNSYANRLNNRACKIGIGSSAISLLDQAIYLNRDNPLYFANLGLLYARMDSSITLNNLYSGNVLHSGKLDTAIFYYHIAESLKNNDPLFCQNLALLYALRGDIKIAIENIEKAAGDTDDIWYLLIAGFLYEKYDKDKAEEFYVRAMYVSPDLFGSLLYSNLMYRDSILGVEVKKSLLSYLKESHGETEELLVLAKLAKILWIEGCKDDAEVLWYKVTQAMPMWSTPWLYLGQIEEDRGDTVIALSYYHKAESLNPIGFSLSLSGEDLQDSIVHFDVDSLLKYMPSGREKIYRSFFNAILLSKGMAINDFDKYQKVTMNLDRKIKGGTEKPE